MKKTLLDYTLRIRLPIILFVGVVCFIAAYFFSRAERDGIGYAPVQPIAFSHKFHAGTMQIDCQYCHTAVTVSTQATIPSVAICMNCHAIARKNKPEIVKLTKYYEEGIAIPWKRVHRLPDYAYFNHSVHINKGIECAICHGKVEDMDGALQVSEFTMAACLNCHRSAPTSLAEFLLPIKSTLLDFLFFTSISFTAVHIIDACIIEEEFVYFTHAHQI